MKKSKGIRFFSLITRVTAAEKFLNGHLNDDYLVNIQWLREAIYVKGERVISQNI